MPENGEIETVFKFIFGQTNIHEIKEEYTQVFIQFELWKWIV